MIIPPLINIGIVYENDPGYPKLSLDIIYNPQKRSFVPSVE
jgi:hypothetical protein